MATFERVPPWWDREVDCDGRAIRADVRWAAVKIWEQACRRAQALLGDSAIAAEVLECAVSEVSRYLDRTPTREANRGMSGLLLLAFSRGLKRRAAKLSRFQAVGGASHISDCTVGGGWSRQVDACIDLNKVVRKLSDKNSMVLALRYAGYDWKEIAKVLGTSVALVRNSFWREIGYLRKVLSPHCHRAIKDIKPSTFQPQ